MELLSYPISYEWLKASKQAYPIAYLPSVDQYALSLVSSILAQLRVENFRQARCRSGILILQISVRRSTKVVIFSQNIRDSYGLIAPSQLGNCGRRLVSPYYSESS
jgi:hypothetical protein